MPDDERAPICVRPKSITRREFLGAATVRTGAAVRAPHDTRAARKTEIDEALQRIGHTAAEAA